MKARERNWNLFFIMILCLAAFGWYGAITEKTSITLAILWFIAAIAWIGSLLSTLINKLR